MRVNLTKDTMDVVMAIVRKHGIKLEDCMEFIINNHEEIEVTRGELYGQNYRRKKQGKNQ